MMAVAKHFPGHGGVIADSHLELPEDHRDYAAMTDDLAPYHRLIVNGLKGVMIAHVRYPQIDRRIASLSPYWMKTELRENLAFTGAIFSDDLNMSAMECAGDMPERVRQTLQAGADMILLCNNRGSVGPVLESLEGYAQPVSHGRLAAMRADFNRYAEVPYGSPDWEQSLATLRSAQERPSLILDGEN